MNDTKKEIKSTHIDNKILEKHLDELHLLLIGLNAYGSLSLKDYGLIMTFLNGAFSYSPDDEN